VSPPYPPFATIGPAAIARWALATMTNAVVVEGLEHVPRDGPVLVAARHYHHLLDGAVLVRHFPRPVHLVVALDWAADTVQRRWMERACALAQWPVILRPAMSGNGGAYAASEVPRYVRRGLRDAALLLRDGRVVVVFPEGYPLVDPHARAPQERDAEGFLPFAGGVGTIARLAQRAGAAPIALLPLGFRYERSATRWTIRARIGAPLALASDSAAIARAVRALSR
jgi:putative membrane protein